MFAWMVKKLDRSTSTKINMIRRGARNGFEVIRTKSTEVSVRSSSTNLLPYTPVSLRSLPNARNQLILVPSNRDLLQPVLIALSFEQGTVFPEKGQKIFASSLPNSARS